MPLINTSVPNLIQGVSQQPDATRFAGQCEEQENALSSVAEGLKKRPNTRHIAKLLTSAIDSNSFVHFINRSDTEKYVVIHDGTKIRTFNLSNGNEGSINSSTDGYTPIASDYLFSTNPRADLKAMTVGDSTFIVNTTKTVSASSGLTAGYQQNLAGFFVKQGDYKKEYEINISGNSFPKLEAVTETTGSFSTTTSNTYENFSSLDGDAISNPTITTGNTDFMNSNHADYFAATNPLRVTGFNLSGNRDNFWNSSKPIKIILRWGFTIYPTFVLQGQENTPTQSSSYFDVTDGFDIVYNDTFNRVDSITAKAASDANVFLQYFNDYLYQYSLYLTSNPSLIPPIREYLVVDASNYSIPAFDLKRFIISESGDNDNANAASTKKIAKTLITGSDRHIYDTFNANSSSNSATNGDFTFKAFRADGKLANTSQVVSSTFFLENSVGVPFTVSVSDGLGGGGLGMFYEEIDTISSLPIECKKDFAIKIIGDAELNQDDYYVKFQTKSFQAFGQGSWVETAGFNQSRGLDNSTMPHRIINNAVDTFTVEAVTYADREAGDDDTNPHPSFLNNNITNLFLYKDRLGFVSNENVIMSGSGDLFNFYRKTVTTLLDDAPIDVSVASGRVLNLSSAVGFQENLILFGDNGQFALKGGDILTPRTVSVNPITNFSLEDQVAPLPLGSYIYFPFTRGNFTGVREFTVNASTDNYDSTEVTEHVPAYVPKNIVDMAGTTSEDIIALLSGDEKSSLYIYNYFWNNNQKVLSAWSKFSFVGEIRGIEFIDSTLYAVITNNGETNLVEMPLESGLTDASGFVTHLDMRVASTVAHGTDEITLPYTPADNSVEVYTTDGLKLNCTNVGATVTLAQAVSADTPVFVGIPYTMKYTFSEQLFKAKAGQGSSPSNAAKLMVRNGSVYYDNTSHFKVTVTPKFRDPYVNTFTTTVVGSSTLGSLELDSGFYRFPVFTKAEDTTITIENDSALPSNFQSAEFESFVHSRSNRYG